MKVKTYRHFVGDFETTVYAGQEFTEVWASAVVEFNTEDVKIFHSIDETLLYLMSLRDNVIIYYHNLKFDGNFWLSHLLTKGWKQAYREIRYTSNGKEMKTVEWLPEKEMVNKSFKYAISDRGQWYSIILKANNRYIEIRDSLKLLPMSVKRIGKSFATKHQKLDMEYEGYRYAGCNITDEEKKYIANDVLVVKEALEIMFNLGHDKITIGSNCLAEYKQICKTSLKNVQTYDEMFPDLLPILCKSDDKDTHDYGAKNADEYIRHSYKGGWCYLARGKSGRIYKRGCTVDVNSLYPSMMHSCSGNIFPVGYPQFWHGDFIPDEATKEGRYYFIRIKTRFHLKKNKLPFIQIKGNTIYNGTESLETSDYRDSNGNYSRYYIDTDTGIKHDTRVTLTLTCVDYKLFKEHYNVSEFEILDGCYFRTQKGIFDEYIDKYREIKQKSKNGVREIAKLFLNNLYGKLSSNDDSSFKVAHLEDGVLKFIAYQEHNKKLGFIPVGSAITSYSRNFTIRAAQSNIDGFLYADTDSLHCSLSPEQLQGITIHPKDFCCWKVESEWDKGIFVRQKTYIEHIVKEDGIPVEDLGKVPYNNIKCAGMPDKCKNLFDLSLQEKASAVYSDLWTDEEKKFLFGDTRKPITRNYYDFNVGLCVPDKLSPKRVRGGIILRNTTYEMR